MDKQVSKLRASGIAPLLALSLTCGCATSEPGSLERRDLSSPDDSASGADAASVPDLAMPDLALADLSLGDDSAVGPEPDLSTTSPPDLSTAAVPDLSSVTMIKNNGCNGGTCLNPMCTPFGTATPVGPYPDTGFDAQPAYIPNDVIIPTFDDGPDGENAPPDPVYGVGSWTATDLTFFAMNNMHVDFFVNTNNWCGDITQDGACTAALTNILTSHNAANHTVHHIHMGIAGTMSDPGCPDAPSCEVEIVGVETEVNNLSRGGISHLTRFRAPFGEPFQALGPGLAMAQTLVAKYAVQVGWNLDSGDSLCNSTTTPCFTGQQIANNITTVIGTKPGSGTRWGIVLMHGTYPWTHDALPLLFGPNGYLAKHSFRVGTVEDAICWKYGKHSWEIVQQNSGQTRGPN
jgi:peptidoglycan/xylan/chitin deacetylase (PgdA/CDA1 family)